MARSRPSISVGLLIHSLFYTLLKSVTPEPHFLRYATNGPQFVDDARDLQDDEILKLAMKLAQVQEFQGPSTQPSTPSHAPLKIPL